MAYRRERSASSASASRGRLHNFTLPGLNWGATKQLRCMKANPNSRILMHPSLSAPATDQSREAENEVTHLEQNQEFAVSPEKNSEHMEDPMEDLQRGCEEMRVSEMEEKRKGKEKVAEDDGNENRSAGAWTWNLRTRRNACKAPRGNDGDDVMVDVPAELVVGSGGGGGGGSGGVYSPARRMDGRLRGGAGMGTGVERKMEKPKFSFALTKEEIENDFLLMTGAKPPLKPKARPKRLQKKLNDLVPGLWLREEITPATYKVRERQSKKGLN